MVTIVALQLSDNPTFSFTIIGHIKLIHVGLERKKKERFSTVHFPVFYRTLAVIIIIIIIIMRYILGLVSITSCDVA